MRNNIISCEWIPSKLSIIASYPTNSLKIFSKVANWILSVLRTTLYLFNCFTKNLVLRVKCLYNSKEPVSPFFRDVPRYSIPLKLIISLPRL